MRRDRTLKQEIRHAFWAGRPGRQEEFLRQMPGDGFAEQRYRRAGSARIRFYFQQLGYIRGRVWGCAAALFAAVILFVWLLPCAGAPFFGANAENGMLQAGRWEAVRNTGDALLCCFSALLPLLAVLLVAEGNRSFRYGMKEIEMCARHSLTEVYLARMLFLGCGNLLWIGAADVLIRWTGSAAVDFVLVYLLVPYLLSLSLSLGACRRSPRNATGGCTAAGCAVSVGYLLLRDAFDIYAERYLAYWAVACIGLTAWIVRQHKDMKKIWEGQVCS